MEPVKRQPKDTPPADELAPLIVDAAVGDRVRVRREVKKPTCDWGGATAKAVGRLAWFEGDRCVVDFPQHPRWNVGRERFEPPALRLQGRRPPPLLTGLRAPRLV